MKSMLNFASPTDFLRLARVLIPFSAALTALLLGIGLYLAFFVAPPDYQQGETVRIMYLHVPAAWLAMLIYFVMTSAALGTLVWRHPLADAAQKAAAPLGAGFTLLCLATGSLWGKPMWGTWWVWDARLTSVLVLFLIYLGLVALWRTIEDPGKAARAAAIFTLVGAVNIPIIKFSVDWWNTLHQPASVFRLGGPAIAPSMLWPLVVMALAFTVLFVTLYLMAIRNEILRRRLRRLSILAAGAQEPVPTRGSAWEAAYEPRSASWLHHRGLCSWLSDRGRNGWDDRGGLFEFEAGACVLVAQDTPTPDGRNASPGCDCARPGSGRLGIDDVERATAASEFAFRAAANSHFCALDFVRRAGGAVSGPALCGGCFASALGARRQASPGVCLAAGRRAAGQTRIFRRGSPAKQSDARQCLCLLVRALPPGT